MQRYHYLTILRIFAMCGVVALHTIMPPVTSFSDLYTPLQLKLSVFLLNIFWIYGVPVFFMISGALFLNPQKEITVKKCLNKSIRLFILLLIIGTIFALMELIAVNMDFSIHYLYKSFFNMLSKSSWGHLWYLYVIISLYIITPCLRKIIENDCGMYLCIILLIFNVIIPFISDIGTKLLGDYGWKEIAFKLPFEGNAITYFILGWAFSTKKLRLPDIAATIIICTLLLYDFLCVFVFTCFENAVLPFWDIYNLLGVLFSVSVFSLFLSKFENGTDSKWQIILSDYSYGIYIFHAVFINIAYKILKLNPQKINLFLMWLLVFSLSIIFSFIITFILKKIPIIKKFI